MTIKSPVSRLFGSSRRKNAPALSGWGNGFCSSVLGGGEEKGGGAADDGGGGLGTRFF